MAKKRSAFSDQLMNLYAALAEGANGVEIKGAAMPYTSLNGNMFSFISPDGLLNLRLSEKDRDAFMKKYKTKLSVQHGVTLKEYVVVPEKLLVQTGALKPYFRQSYDYVSTLKPKVRKK